MFRSNHVNGNVGSLSVSPSLTSCATYMSRASDALVRVQVRVKYDSHAYNYGHDAERVAFGNEVKLIRRLV